MLITSVVIEVASAVIEIASIVIEIASIVIEIASAVKVDHCQCLLELLLRKKF